MTSAKKSEINTDALICLAEGLNYFININDLTTVRLYTSQLTPKEIAFLRVLLTEWFYWDIYKIIHPFVRTNTQLPEPILDKVTVGLPVVYESTFKFLV